MLPRPVLSLIVPTRHRPAQLRCFLDSLTATAARPESLEVVLVVDADDPASQAVRHDRLALKHVVGPPGRTMGSLNADGGAAAVGDYLMLLNDDVVARTRRWDETILTCLRGFPDGVVLAHVNDTLMRENLCTFPVVSRVFRDMAGGICPREYVRYRIDDHVEDVFNLMAYLGERRTVYLPDVVFEHLNAVEHPEAGRVYLSDPAVLALDAPRFDALFASRKELALRLLDYVEGGTSPDVLASRRRELAGITDPFALRTPGRQRVVRTASAWSRGLQYLAKSGAMLMKRVRDRVRREGYRGLARAAGRKAARTLRAG